MAITEEILKGKEKGDDTRTRYRKIATKTGYRNACTSALIVQLKDLCGSTLPGLSFCNLDSRHQMLSRIWWQFGHV